MSFAGVFVIAIILPVSSSTPVTAYTVPPSPVVERAMKIAIAILNSKFCISFFRVVLSIKKRVAVATRCKLPLCKLFNRLPVDFHKFAAGYGIHNHFADEFGHLTFNCFIN